MLFDKADLVKIKKNHPQDCHVMCKEGGNTWLGLHEDVRQGKVYPAALVVGLIKPNCIITLPVGSDLVWFCVLQHGHPLVGLDRILDGKQSLIYQEQYRALFPTYETLITSQGSENDLAALLKESLQVGTLQGIGSKHLRSMLMKSPSQSRKLRIKIGCVSACVLGLVVLSFEYVNAQLNLNTHARAAFERTLSAAHLQEEDLKSKAEQEKVALLYVQDVQRQREAYLIFADPAQLWNAFNAIRHDIPISTNGMHATALRCEVNACVVEWVLRGRLKSSQTSFLSEAQKPPFGLPFALDRGLNAQGVSSSTIAIDLKKRTYRFPDLLNPEQLELYMALDLKKRWPNLVMTPLKTGFVQAPESLRGKSSLVEGSLVEGSLVQGRFEPHSNRANNRINQQGTSKADQILVHQGQWEMSFAGDGALFEAERFLNEVNDHPVQLQTVVYTYREGLKLKGRYYFLPPLKTVEPARVDLKAREQDVHP